MSRFLVDVCIPVYKEKGYIERTLKNLSNQNLFKQGKVHIIVGEYKDPEARYDFYVRNLCTLFPNTAYLPIDKKGIGYARAKLADSTLSDIIMCFDADSVFNRLDAIDLMIAPILSGEVVMTNCECVLFDFNTKTKSKTISGYTLYDNFATNLEKVLVARGPGITISKEAYDRVGGFRKVTVGEDWWMAWDIIKTYGILKKKHVSDVIILTSDRRSKAYDKHGDNAYNYEMAFR